MPIPVSHLMARMPIAFPAVPMTTRDRMLTRSSRSSITCTMAHHPHHGLRSLPPRIQPQGVPCRLAGCLLSWLSVVDSAEAERSHPPSGERDCQACIPQSPAVRNRQQGRNRDGNGRSESEECVGEVERRESRLWMEQSAQANQHPRQTRTCAL